MVVHHHQKRQRHMEPPVELMYRPPNEDTHKNITQVLDELILQVQRHEERIFELEEQVEQLLLIID